MKKKIYLDIDMDYFVLPIERSSVDNLRPYAAEECSVSPVKPVFDKLAESRLTWDTAKVHGFTNHMKSYTYWWMQKKIGCSIIHIDAHSDLYRNSKADLRMLSNGEIRCYNYLWYGLRDGYVDEVFWVIPEDLQELLMESRAGEIINQALIEETYMEGGALNIIFRCIDINGVLKSIRLCVCTLDKLPAFHESKYNREIERVTIATSPEFIPEKADELIYDLLGGFGLDKDKCDNLYKQHKAMIKNTADSTL